jgi:hypothetical protein
VQVLTVPEQVAHWDEQASQFHEPLLAMDMLDGQIVWQVRLL